MQIITQKTESAHWYSKTGVAQHTIIGKSTGRPRPTTIRDARQNDWVPSVTTVLKVLHKPALERWKIGQAVMACMTATRNDGEGLDAFIDRVLNVEEQQHQEAETARELGSDIHTALEGALSGTPCLPELEPYVRPAMEAIAEMRKQFRNDKLNTEKILVGDGYAGMTDLIIEQQGPSDSEIIIDFKTTKSIPKSEPWHEHRLQLAAYAGTRQCQHRKIFNLYISTTQPGKIALLDAGDWRVIYEKQWLPLLAYWRAVNEI